MYNNLFAKQFEDDEELTSSENNVPSTADVAYEFEGYKLN